MFNNPYMFTRFMPNMYGRMPFNAMDGALRGGSSLGGLGSITRGSKTLGGGGLFSKLSGTFSSLKNLNWGGFINNTSKTLGVINQTIPLVKQAGPMFRNIKSVMRLASVFKDETDPPRMNKTNNSNISKIEANDNKKETSSYKESSNSSLSNSNNLGPVFFVD